MFLQLKMASSFMAKPTSFHPQKGRISSMPYMKDIWASASISTMPDTVCIGLVLMQTLDKSLNHISTCQHHHLPKPSQLFQPIQAPEHLWEDLHVDYFQFDCSEYLVITDYYSKMPIVQRILISQCNASKTTSVLKKLFAEHGIPETLHTDNCPQFANAFFTEFTMEWKFDHYTSLPQNPQSNGQAETTMEIVKRLFTCVKCS